MKKLFLTTLLLSGFAFANQLEDIQKAGVIKIATFDSNPPFGSIDAQSKEIVGYDIDFANALAAKLGVKVEFVATNPANRIPLLTSGRVDLIVADITITNERAEVIDFSLPYFKTGQQILVRKDASNNLNDFAKARIGAVKGTTGETNLKEKFPQSKVISYDDIPLAFTALRAGSVKAISQDETILAGLLAAAPDKDSYKILPDLLSVENIGVGVKKGEKELLDFVNQELVNLEQEGLASQIYEKWFGEHTKAPQTRNFTIGFTNE